mmetsp:Transcript_39048/g.91178  ORF Transcript_39048/g.91178 Transcript_39048/m.91178 type:complete len:221 (+) Transcript_39048:1584-2246(+)
MVVAFESEGDVHHRLQKASLPKVRVASLVLHAVREEHQQLVPQLLVLLAVTVLDKLIEQMLERFDGRKGADLCGALLDQLDNVPHALHRERHRLGLEPDPEGVDDGGEAVVCDELRCELPRARELEDEEEQLVEELDILGRLERLRKIVRHPRVLNHLVVVRYRRGLSLGRRRVLHEHAARSELHAPVARQELDPQGPDHGAERLEAAVLLARRLFDKWN